MAATPPQIRFWDDEPSMLDLLGGDAVVDPILGDPDRRARVLVDYGRTTDRRGLLIDVAAGLGDEDVL